MNWFLQQERIELSDENTCKNFIIQNKPDWIINAGAYTNVDKAEEETKIALSVNSKAPKILQKSWKIKAVTYQISTDFVFGGHQNFPYKTDVSKHLYPFGWFV